MSEKTWSQKRPAQPGWYWYYGDAFAGDANFEIENELGVARVDAITNGVIYIVNGNFLSERKGCPGWWMPMIAPEPPQEPSP